LSKIDYQKIDVENFLQELGMRNVVRDGREIRFSCPFEGHKHGDANPSASMRQGDTVFHCFGCGRNFNALTFLAEYEQFSPLKAARYIREWLGDDFKEPEGSISDEIETLLSKKQEKKLVRNQPLDMKELDKRRVHWHKRFIEEDYLLSRNFHWDTLDEWNIGWDNISRRYTIPYFDLGGELIGFKGRALDSEIGPDQARYKVIGGSEYGFDTFDVSMCLFGIDKINDWVDSFTWPHLIVCEGELNVLALWQMQIGPAVGISGKHLSDAQVYLLKKIGRPPILFFDDVKDAEKAAEKLVKDLPTSIVPEHKLDPADSTSNVIKDLLLKRQNAIIKGPTMTNQTKE
jgi:DNA primase